MRKLASLQICHQTTKTTTTDKIHIYFEILFVLLQIQTKNIHFVRVF